MSVLLTGRNPIKTTVTKTETKTETITAYPQAYLTSDYSYASISGATNPVGKGSSNTTYATINLKTGSSATTHVYFPFDFSSIPENATINSISCTAKGYISSTSSSYVNTRQMQLFTGTTAKGSSVNLTTSATAQTLTCGTWTRAELQNCRLRMYAKRGTSSTSISRSINMRFYGAEITVTYTYSYEVEEEVWI